MKIEIDLEKEDMFDLKHVKCIIDRKIGDLTLEDPSFPEGLEEPFALLEELERKVGKTISVSNFFDEMGKNKYTKKETAEALESLKKGGYVFEDRLGYIRII